jgi:putative transposase
MPNHLEQFARIVIRLSQLDAPKLAAVESVIGGFEELESGIAIPKEVQRNQSGTGLPHSKETKDWPRAPIHRLEEKGAFMVTGGTLYKEHHFRTPEALDYLEADLLKKVKEYDWELEAWAVFSNHYHFIGQALTDAESLSPMLNHLHSDTVRWFNERDQEIDRQVWYNFWETELTYSKSYQARLNYVHRNAVHHGLVTVPSQYPYCSAAWFERTATRAQVKTIYSFKSDRLKVIDDFAPIYDGP